MKYLTILLLRLIIFTGPSSDPLRPGIRRHVERTLIRRGVDRDVVQDMPDDGLIHFALWCLT